VLVVRRTGYEAPMQLTRREPSADLTVRFQPRARVAVMLVAAITMLVFALDRGTGLPHVQHLYYIPIIFAAMTLGTFGGAAAAVLTITLYHLANSHALTWRYEESDILQMAVLLRSV
jgi:K+-sensing histidine kinase KdpD